jgi:hypothetical protein
VARESSARRAVAGQKLSAPGAKHTKVVRHSVVAEMEVTAVGGGVVPPNGRPFVKRPQVVEPAATNCCTMAREKKSARRAGAGEEFSAPSPKRAKVTRNAVKTSVDPALVTLRKRMAAELDALHALVRKAELLSSGNGGRPMAAAEPRSEAPPEEASIKTPPAKRAKVHAIAKVAKLETTEDDNEVIDICGGVSPVAILKASPVVSLEKEVAGSSEIMDPPEDDDEFIDICGGVSPIAILKASPVVSVEKAGETGSSSSSDSDSDSDSESDRDETVDHPVPQAVLPVEENVKAVLPVPEPATEVVQSTEPEKLPTAALIAKAKVRQKLLEMERAALPDEIIHPGDLQDLCIAEYGRPSIMRQLGLFLKADA